MIVATLWRAELLKLSSRLTARLGLVVAAALGVILPVILWTLGSSEILWNGAPLSDVLSLDAATGSLWALRVRNFYVMRMFLIVLAALSFAGELQARTLREDLLRPVPRWAVLLAKWLALGTWLGGTLLLPWVLSLVVGAVLLGMDGSWSVSVQTYLATFAADLGFAALALAVSVVARSVAATVGGVFLFLVLDTMLGWFLWFARMIRTSLPPEATDVPVWVDWLLEGTIWLPSSAFAVWFELLNEADPTWQSWVALGGITVVCLGVAERWFARMDVL